MAFISPRRFPQHCKVFHFTWKSPQKSYPVINDKFAQVMSRMANSQYCYMMTSSNGTFSAYLVLCEGNPPVTGGFPSQRPVTRSFDVFFDLRMKKRSSKQSRHRWFARPSCPLWRHCNVMNPHYYLCCKLDDGSAEDRAFIYCLAQTIA